MQQNRGLAPARLDVLDRLSSRIRPVRSAGMRDQPLTIIDGREDLVMTSVALTEATSVPSVGRAGIPRLLWQRVLGHTPPETAHPSGRRPWQYQPSGRALSRQQHALAAIETNALDGRGAAHFGETEGLVQVERRLVAC
ncbi:hypothetical protein [Streptomyces sp. 130]|uniref:hypothetical protein n=1 Tax=Streptomyces sp. 130 TaxID=2591006 RepID=UPI0021B14097|nr:hypothetical protein [Streptomyces sp. 130]